MKVEPIDTDAFLTNLLRAPQSGRFLLALSGGVDSMVLLHLLHSVRDTLRGRELRAIHVNHQLHADAAAWAALCQNRCDALGVPLDILTVTVSGAGGLEAAARQTRYEAIASRMQPEDVVLSAHHADDQSETLLLHLLRGSGVRGLAGMPLLRSFGAGWLLRPLLHLQRVQLQAYAEQQGLDWVDDPSNHNQELARNFLRHAVMPLLRQRWPDAVNAIATSAGLLQEADAMVSASVATLLGRLCDQHGRLDWRDLHALTQEAQAEALRHWCRQHLHSVPPRRQLLEFLRQLSSDTQAQPLLCWADCVVGRYRDWLIAHKALAEVATDWHAQWNGRGLLELPGGLGYLELQGNVPDLLTVHFRQGAEQFLLHGLHRDLKTLFQELAIPAWLRHGVPLLSCNDRVLALADFWVADDVPDLKLTWHRGPAWPVMLRP